MKELIIKNYNADKNDDRLSNFLMMYNFYYKEKKDKSIYDLENV